MSSSRYTSAQSEPGSARQPPGAAGSGGASGGGSEQSVSLAPPAWAARLFGRGTAAAGAAEAAALQRGTAAVEEEEDGSGVESLRESSVVVRSVVPPAILSDADGTPLKQSLHLHNSPSPSRQPAAAEAAPAAGRAAAGGAAAGAAGNPWEFPQLGTGLGQGQGLGLFSGWQHEQQPAAAAALPAEARAAVPPAPAPLQRSLFQGQAAQQQQQPLAWPQPQPQQQAWQPTPLPQQQPPQPAYQQQPWQAQQQQPPQPAYQQQQQQQQQQPEVPAAARYDSGPLPPLAAQQPLPPGRFGWQRVQRASQLPAEAAIDPLPSANGSDVGASFGAAVASKGLAHSDSLGAPSAPSMGAADSWLQSIAASESQQQAAGAAAQAPQQQGPPLRPPSAASEASFHRAPSSQQRLLPAEAALYGAPAAAMGAGGAAAWGGAAGWEAGRGGSGGLGSSSSGHLPTGKSSPVKSLAETASFRVEAYAGAPGAAGAGGASGRLRPSRTAALRKRHAAQLRNTDRDQYGVPVASSARPFSLWASPQKIGEACTGLGVYFASVKQFIVAALLLSLVAIYPLVSNLTSQRWASSYVLVVDEAPQLSCAKGWSTNSWVTGSTAGSRCASSTYSSSFDCPSVCAWNSSQLSQSAGGQCAGLPPPQLPSNAAKKAGPANATCLLHPPCSAGGSSDPAAPDGPCYCCQLALDPEQVPGPSSGAGTVPAAQLWVLLLGQVAFLVWVLLLTRSQLHAVHSADARVISASDYSVRLQGVPRGLKDSDLQAFCSHYGSMVAAFHVPDVGDALRVAQRLQLLLARRAESDAWAACPSCWASSCWFNLWALGAASRRRLGAAVDDAQRELACYERQDLRPTGAALAVFEYAEHAANCIEDHHRSALRRGLDASLCGATASAPRLVSTRIRVDRAPEPSDILWENTACTGSAATWRRLGSAALTLLIVAGGAGVQYGLAMAAEQERKSKLSKLYQYDPSESYTLDFSSWATFTASALEVTKLNAISILSGLAVVFVNWLVTVAVRQLAVLERWHTRTASERWALLKLSVSYLVNSFVVPLLAAYFAGSSNSWYSRGGLLESAFYMQLANAILPPLAVLCDLEEMLYFHLISRLAKTQEMADRLLQPPPFLLAEQYASALTTLGLGVCWMPVLPVSPYLAVLGLFLHYWADKLVALRRTAHPGNMRGKLVSSADLLIRLLPLAQLLLMRFVFFVGEGAMTAVFWTGLAVWLLFAIAPLRSLLGLVPRRRSTVTGGLSFQETLGGGQRKGLDDRYEPEVPPCCTPAYQRQVSACFTHLPQPRPACEELLPRQRPATGGTATRPPFRPDRSADRAVARAAASLRARQQAVLAASASSAVVGGAGAGIARGGSGSMAPYGDPRFSFGAGGAGAAMASGGELHAASPPAAKAAAAAGAQGASPMHRRHTRQQSGASGGAGARLGRTLSAIRGGLASGASWMWTVPNPDDLFSYDWAQAGDTVSSATAPPLPGTPRNPGMA